MPSIDFERFADLQAATWAGEKVSTGASHRESLHGASLIFHGVHCIAVYFFFGNILQIWLHSEKKGMNSKSEPHRINSGDFERKGPLFGE